MVFQNYPIAILSALEGLSIETSLDQARYILEAVQITGDASAVVQVDGRAMATIVLRSAEDRSKGLDILTEAGLKVKAGAAGF